MLYIIFFATFSMWGATTIPALSTTRKLADFASEENENDDDIDQDIGIGKMNEAGGPTKT